MASILTKKPKNTKLKELKTLGQQLLSSRAHINNLPLLLTFISPSSPPQHVLESLLSVQSFFTTVLPHLPPSSSSKKKRRRLDDSAKEDPEFIYRTWLRSKFDEFITLLIAVLVSPDTEEALREIVLDSFMEFVKLGNGKRFYSAIYHKLLRSIVHSATSVEIVLELLASKYFKYIDVRYFTFISLEKLVNTLDVKDAPDDKTVGADYESVSQSRESVELSIRKIHYIISHVPPLEGIDGGSEREMWSGSGLSSEEEHDKKELSELKKSDKEPKTEKQNVDVLSVGTIAKKMKLKFTKAWISFLRLPIPIDVYKEVLATLHQAVIPHLSNPIILCDFLTRSYDIGGVVSVMALSSLFILMTQHGLEYPNFYEKLYALLAPSIFMAKHRGKFFQLLDSCLKSPLLPAYLAAAFAKKLSRLAVSVPPSGALVIIALIHNLLRRHPSINSLVHKEDSAETRKDNSKSEDVINKADDSGSGTEISRKRSGIDHFNNEESNPMKSNAMRSSLWEIDTLRHHYCPPVSRFVLSLENDLTDRSKTTEMDIKDFSSGSYATIFGDEIRRRVKQVPLAFYKTTPTSLFPSESEFCGWTFKYEESKDNDSGNKEQSNSIANTSEENDISAKRQRIECS